MACELSMGQAGRRLDEEKGSGLRILGIRQHNAIHSCIDYRVEMLVGYVHILVRTAERER